MMNQAPMGYPQEEKEEEKEIDWEDEEGGDAGVAELPQLPVGGPPRRRGIDKRLSRLSTMFDEGNKGRLNKHQQKARSMAHKDGTINPEAALANVKQQRRQMRMLWGVSTLSVITFLSTIIMALKMNGTVVQWGEGTQDTIVKTVQTSVGFDSSRKPHLVDRELGMEITTRSEGDNFSTTQEENGVDCMPIQNAAHLVHDVAKRTPASIIFKDENDLEREIIPIDGHFKDMGSYLQFGDVKILLDSDRCNNGAALTNPDAGAAEDYFDEVEDGEEVEGVGVEEEAPMNESEYEIDIEPAIQAALEDSQDKKAHDDTRIFDRHLLRQSVVVSPRDNGAVAAGNPPVANPDARGKVVEVPASRRMTNKNDGRARHLSKPDILRRNRKEYREHHAALLAGRRLEESTTSVQVCTSGSYCDIDAPPHKKVFITSSRYSGNLGGTDGANMKCQSLADSAGLGGTYRAWISKRTSSGVLRGPSNSFVHTSDLDSYPYYLVHAQGGVGARVADNWADLVDGNIKNPIKVNQIGINVPTGSRVWTGVNGAGNRYGPLCNLWKSGSQKENGLFGHADYTNVRWTKSSSAVTCTNNYRLYCFQQDVSNLDSDGDGLSDIYEDEIGTESTNSDTDGDGLSDGDEFEIGTNPLQADPSGLSGGFVGGLACTYANSGNSDDESVDDNVFAPLENSPLDSLEGTDDTDISISARMKEYLNYAVDTSATYLPKVLLPQKICSDAVDDLSTRVGVTGSQVAACGFLDMLSDTDVLAFGLGNSAELGFSFCGAFHDGTHTYALAQIDILPPIKLGALTDFNVNALAVSLSKQLSATTLNEMWDGTAAPAALTIPGHFVLRGTGNYGMTVQDKVSLTVVCDTTVLIDLDYNNNGVAPANGAVDFAMMISGSLGPKFTIGYKENGQDKSLILDLRPVFSTDADFYMYVDNNFKSVQLAISRNMYLEELCDVDPIFESFCVIFKEASFTMAVRAYANNDGFGIQFAIEATMELRSGYDILEDVIGWPNDNQVSLRLNLSLENEKLKPCLEFEGTEFCTGTCEDDADCDSDQACDSVFKVCRKKRAIGHPCSKDSACQSGICSGAPVGFCQQCAYPGDWVGCPAGETCMLNGFSFGPVELLECSPEGTKQYKIDLYDNMVPHSEAGLMYIYIVKNDEYEQDNWSQHLISSSIEYHGGTWEDQCNSMTGCYIIGWPVNGCYCGTTSFPMQDQPHANKWSSGKFECDGDLFGGGDRGYSVIICNGSDNGFFIDRMEIMKNPPIWGVAEDFGAHGGGGYCLSTQPGDDFSDKCSAAYECTQFKMDGSTVKGVTRPFLSSPVTKQCRGV